MSTTLAAQPVDARAVYQLAFRKEKDALRALAPLWQVTLGEGDACQQAQQQSLACFRNSGGLALIRRSSL